jgi:1-aminocyclopropane-1-carboxylate deaminase
MHFPDSVQIDTFRFSRGGGDAFALDVLRLDKIHPITGGNKWFKLIHNIRTYRAGAFEAIVSFGGPFSNHLAALAACCSAEGIPCIGIVRETESGFDTPTLNRAAASGMQIDIVSRTQYRLFREPGSHTTLRERYGNVLVIPEGGSNEHGVRGCAEIATFIPDYYTDVVVAVGTGCTLAGLEQGLPIHQRLIGVKVLEANQEKHPVCAQLSQRVRWENGFTCGAYARTNPELAALVEEWNRRFPFACVEPVYTAKALNGVITLMERGAFTPEARVLLCHTGGLQAFHG